MQLGKQLLDCSSWNGDQHITAAVSKDLELVAAWWRLTQLGLRNSNHQCFSH